MEEEYQDQEQPDMEYRGGRRIEEEQYVSLIEDSQELAEIEDFLSAVHPSPHNTPIQQQIRDIMNITDYYIDQSDLEPSNHRLSNIIINQRNRDYYYLTGLAGSNQDDTGVVGGQTDTPGGPSNDYPLGGGNGNDQTSVETISPQDIRNASLTVATGSLFFALAGAVSIYLGQLNPMIGVIGILILLGASISSFIFGREFSYA